MSNWNSTVGRIVKVLLLVPFNYVTLAYLTIYNTLYCTACRPKQAFSPVFLPGVKYIKVYARGIISHHLTYFPMLNFAAHCHCSQCLLTRGSIMKTAKIGRSAWLNKLTEAHIAYARVSVIRGDFAVHSNAIEDRHLCHNVTQLQNSTTHTTLHG